MRRLLLALALAAGFLVLAPGPATACSCDAVAVPQLVRGSDSVATGRVVWTTEHPERISYGVRFDTVFKGELAEREKVRTSRFEESCGLSGRLAQERDYVFFLQGMHRGEITANLCAPPVVASDRVVDQVVEVTGAGRQPLTMGDDEPSPAPAGEQPRWLYFAGAAAILFILLVAYGARGRARRTT